HETMTRGFEHRRCGFVEHQREPIVLTWLLAEHETFQVEDSAASDTVETELIAAAQLAVQANSMPLEGLPSARGDSVLFRQVELRLGNAVACQDRESTGFVGALRVGKLDAAHASQIDVGITQGATLTEVADVGQPTFLRSHQHEAGGTHRIERLRSHSSTEHSPSRYMLGGQLGKRINTLR